MLAGWDKPRESGGTEEKNRSENKKKNGAHGRNVAHVSEQRSYYRTAGLNAHVILCDKSNSLLFAHRVQLNLGFLSSRKPFFL